MVKFHEKDYDRILAIISSEGETIEVRWDISYVSYLLFYSLPSGVPFLCTRKTFYKKYNDN